MKRAIVYADQMISKTQSHANAPHRNCARQYLQGGDRLKWLQIVDIRSKEHNTNEKHNFQVDLEKRKIDFCQFN